MNDHATGTIVIRMLAMARFRAVRRFRRPMYSQTMTTKATMMNLNSAHPDATELIKDESSRSG